MRTYVRLQARRSAADAGWVPQALSLRLLVAALVAVVAVIATAGPLRSQLAGQGVGRGHAARRPRAVSPRGPARWSRSRPRCPTAAPTARRSGFTATARRPPRSRCSAPPASRRRVVRRFGEAAPPSARPELADDELRPRGLRARCWPMRATAARSWRSRRARRCAPASAPRAPPSSPASSRCPSAGSRAAGTCATARSRPCGASGRRPPAASASATRRAARAPRSCCCTTCAARRRCAPRAALVRRERRTGVRATYVLQTRYLADARGAKLVGPGARAARARRARGLRRRGRGRRRRRPARDGAPRRRGRDLSDLRGCVRILDRGRRRDAEWRAARLALRAGRARRGRRRRLPRRLGLDAARLRGRGRARRASTSTPRSRWTPRAERSRSGRRRPTASSAACCGFRSPSTTCRARAPRPRSPRPTSRCAAITAAGRPRSSS